MPPKGYFRLFPGNKVRLKYGHVIECTGATKDADGKVTEVQAELVPDTKSGTPGADAVKVKGIITWVGVADALQAEVRLYDRLFAMPQPDTAGRDFLQRLNPDSLKVVTAYVEPSLAAAKGDDKFQFERHGYFVADRVDHAPGQAGVQPDHRAEGQLGEVVPSAGASHRWREAVAPGQRAKRRRFSVANLHQDDHLRA